MESKVPGALSILGWLITNNSDGSLGSKYWLEFPTYGNLRLQPTEM